MERSPKGIDSNKSEVGSLLFRAQPQLAPRLLCSLGRETEEVKSQSKVARATCDVQITLTSCEGVIKILHSSQRSRHQGLEDNTATKGKVPAILCSDFASERSQSAGGTHSHSPWVREREVGDESDIGRARRRGSKDTFGRRGLTPQSWSFLSSFESVGTEAE